MNDNTIDDYMMILTPILFNPNLPMNTVQILAANALLGHQANWGCTTCKLQAINEIKLKYNIED